MGLRRGEHSCGCGPRGNSAPKCKPAPLQPPLHTCRGLGEGDIVMQCFESLEKGSQSIWVQLLSRGAHAALFLVGGKLSLSPLSYGPHHTCSPKLIQMRKENELPVDFHSIPCFLLGALQEFCLDTPTSAPSCRDKQMSHCRSHVNINGLTAVTQRQHIRRGLNSDLMLQNHSTALVMS